MFSVIGYVSPESPPRCTWPRSARNPVQSAVFATSLVVSWIFPFESVYLTSLINRTMLFITAFSIEIFMSSRQAWVKIPVGIALAMMIIPISWSVLVTVEGGTGFSISNRVHLWKDWLLDSTRVIPGPGSPAGDGKDWEGQGKSEKLRRSRTLKEVFNFIRLPRRQRARTSSTLVSLDLTGSNGSCGLPAGPGVEGENNNKEQESAV